MKKLLLIGGVLFASPVLAQSSTTNCRTDQWGNTTCTTNRDNPVDLTTLNSPDHTQTVAESFRRGQELKQQRDEARRIREHASALATAQEQRMIRIGVVASDLVQSGDCEGAEKLALHEGLYGLYASIREACASPETNAGAVKPTEKIDPNTIKWDETPPNEGG